MEGQTEEEFVKSVLEPHLRGLGLWVYPVVVETSRDAFGRKRRGGGDWSKWLRDIKRLTAQHGVRDVRFTTMFDLYGLPDDFPGLKSLSGDRDTVRRADALERAMAEAVSDDRLIPYLQRHEFEALVLACLDVLAGLLDAPRDLSGVRALKASIGVASPEDINDGASSAPSKRIEAHIPSYRKTVHGPLAVEGAGLDALRNACPRFSRWISVLESLAERSP